MLDHIYIFLPQSIFDIDARARSNTNIVICFFQIIGYEKYIFIDFGRKRVSVEFQPQKYRKIGFTAFLFHTYYKKKPINTNDWTQNWFLSPTQCLFLSLSLSHSVHLISLAFSVLWFCKTYLPAALKELDIPKYKMNNMCNFVFVGRRCGWCNLKYVFPIPKSQMWYSITRIAVCRV